MENKFNIKRFSSLNSTNSWCLKNIDDLNDKDIVIADSQTHGRGRLNRSWIGFGDGKNLYLSIVLKPAGDFRELPLSNLTQYMSIVLCKVMEEEGLNPSIKWPNDILINGKKIAGILSETIIRGNSLKGLVLGTGVNLNISPEQLKMIDKPSTSLNIEIGTDIERDSFLNDVLKGFFENYEHFLSKGFKFIRTDYISKCNFLGNTLTINTPNKIITGIAKEINNEGLLILENESGINTIVSGDIIF